VCTLLLELEKEREKGMKETKETERKQRRSSGVDKAFMFCIGLFCKRDI